MPGAIGRPAIERYAACRRAGSCPPAAARADAVQRFQQLGPARAHQPGQADDLACVDCERDVLGRRPGPLDVRHDELDLEARLARLSPRAPGTVRRSSARPSVATSSARRSLRRRGADHRAVAQDGDPVGEASDLVQPVRDVDDVDAALAQFARSTRTDARPRRRTSAESARP